MKSRRLPLAVRVQRVDIVYTKASRGAPAASLRNRLPRALPTEMRAGAYRFAIEHFQLCEGNGFEPCLLRNEGWDSIPGKYGCLLLTLEGTILLLGLHWPAYQGRPWRPDSPGAVRLKSGQTGRLLINGRQSTEDRDIYTESTFNVVLDDGDLSTGFDIPGPEQVFDLRADLF